MFRRIFKEREDDEDDDDKDEYLVVKLCFHCGRDGEYYEGENICRYCGFSL